MPTLHAATMTTTVSPPQPATVPNGTTATDSPPDGLFTAVALIQSRAYRDHVRKLLLIGLEDIGDE
jgi:hypothetical protein